MDRPKAPLSTEQIEAWVARLPEALRPIKDAILEVASSGAWSEGETGGPLLVGPRPDIAPQAYDIVVFEPLPAERILSYQELHDFKLPRHLLEIYKYINGCSLFEVKLYGIPPSMAVSPPLLDRSRRSPLDIASGRYWRAGYGKIDPDHVLIASRNVGDSGQVGYFMGTDGHISGRGNGSVDAPTECGPWASLAEWLAAEMT